MKCYVYILQSEKNGTFYIGSSDNPAERLKAHNLGQTLYTRVNRPYKLVFSQDFESVAIARKVEGKIKRWKRKDFIEKIIEDGTIRSA